MVHDAVTAGGAAWEVATLSYSFSDFANWGHVLLHVVFGTHYANAWINSGSRGKWSLIKRLASDCMSDLVLQQAFDLHRIVDGFSHSRQKGLPSLAQRDVTGAEYVYGPRAKSLFHHRARWAYTHESTWSRVHEYGWSSFTFLPGKHVQFRPASCDWCRICAWIASQTACSS